MIKISHKGSIKISKLPKKKFLQLQGRTAIDKYSSNEGKTVWIPHVYWKKGIKIINYVIAKCENVKCNGTLVYHNSFKICNECGLMAKTQNNISRGLIEQRYNNNYVYAENTKYRNKLWDNLDIQKLVYYKDKGSKELTDRYIRIKKYEDERKQLNNK